MFLSSKEAAETLSDVERAARRSALAFGYSKASPNLILWGIVWVIGYSGTDLFPAHWRTLWSVLVVTAIVISAVRWRRRDRTEPGNSWRMLGLFAIVFAFVAATCAILWPVRGMQFGAFAPLLTGSIYAGVGLWMGARYVALGALIVAFTLGSYFYLPEHFLLSMAVVGGGGMILAGLWFRQV